MKRRDFAIAIGSATLLAGTARAAGEPVEGKDYRKLGQAVPVAEPGKVEVIEFFGYWCPHCYHFEPVLEPWAAKLPAGVVFRRVPVGWAPVHTPYQKLYFALKEMGLEPTLQRKVFDAVHQQGLRLETNAGLKVFASANGVDVDKLIANINGFSADAKVREANELFRASGADGVPALAVGGRYLTSPGMAGGEARALEIVDALILKVRKAS